MTGTPGGKERGRMYQRIISVSDVIDAYNQSHKIGNKKIILKAYEYALAKHGNTVRGSGELYIYHTLRVARFVAQWGLESDVIAAALLHDVVEDCQAELSELEALFGPGTAQIVDAVTALSDKDFANHTPTKAQKDLLSDVRLQQKMSEKALYVKIADRIDNLSTIDGVPEEKRVPKAEHTREIIIPMALLEHAYAHVDTREELCFRIEHPQMYQAIEERAGAIRARNRRACLKTVQTLREVFAPGISSGRADPEDSRHCLRDFLFKERPGISIFRRISREAANIKKDWPSLLTKERVALYDLTLIVSDRISSEGKSVTPTELFISYFREYLSPKGMYLLRCQRTTYGDKSYFILADEMDNLYRFFVMTETEYRRYLYGDIIDCEDDFAIQDVNEIDPRDTYIEKIKVYDKDGCAVMIEKGATALDFAFCIHTDLGLHFDYAVINDSKARRPAYTRLNSNDMITVVANDQVVPSITWFNYVKTRKAIHHLVNYFQGRTALESAPLIP